MLRILRGVVFLLVIVLATAAGCLLLTPSVCTLWIHSKRWIRWRQLYMAMISQQYYQFISLIYCYISQTKLKVYSNQELKPTSNIFLICNHRTRIDWIFAGWIYTSMIEISGEVKYVLKESLRSIPLFGWCMQILLYIFLTRKRMEDIPHLQTCILYLLNSNPKTSIFLFPEGTDLSESTKKRSHQYAREKGLPCYQYVLHPKPTGFITCVEILQKLSTPVLVHDITLAYDDFFPGMRSSEKSILCGTFPREVNLFIEQVPLPSNTDPLALDEWLRKSFSRKESLLKAYYEQGYRPSSSDTNWKLVYTERDFLQKYSLFSVLPWILCLVLFFRFFEWFRWVCITMIIVYVGGTGFSGLDLIELTLHGNMVLREGKIQREL